MSENDSREYYVCVAQLDRALGYGPRCRGFESSHARLKNARPLFNRGLAFLMHRKKIKRKYKYAKRIDYSRLNFSHKTMMKLLYTKAKRMPEKKKNAEVRAMIETYGKQVDFVDFSKLDVIEQALFNKNS